MGLHRGLGVHRRVALTTFLWCTHLESINQMELKVMFQVLLDHLMCHLPQSGAEVPGAKSAAPSIYFSNAGTPKKSAQRAAFEPPHNFVLSHIGWCIHQNVPVILAQHPTHYPDPQRRGHLS